MGADHLGVTCSKCFSSLRVCDTIVFEMTRLFDQVFEDAQRSWICGAPCAANETCGVINRIEATFCSRCRSERPAEYFVKPDIVTAPDSDYEDMYRDKTSTASSHTLWACLHCTFAENMDGVDVDNCCMCGNSRRIIPEFEAQTGASVILGQPSDADGGITAARPHLWRSVSMPIEGSHSGFRASKAVQNFLQFRRVYGVVVPKSTTAKGLGPALEAEDSTKGKSESSGSIRRQSSVPTTSEELKRAKADLSEDAKMWAEDADAQWQRTFHLGNLVSSMRAYLDHHK